ncbi:helix-turn-helix transcriptional regulator [Paenibacillus sp. FSL R7-0331]|uniref:helix-turn-helix transcriptional regulator n=1 Tax=Paenibacillus sp. FSL R7-0331 TaxID=1536773 RepID=UPI0004F8F5E9|nr:YafY family protein [Paenibacillus sp. FSL R7-0331]AIQ50303.1 DNA-binding protein [Paenibacillus sp. FSL R7-0331]
MSKSKRLLELMMTVNRKRKFTVRELADEFGVSARTILRDLQELSELGVPLYSQVGPHGGYQVLKERILPPIAFTEEEAVAIFFASHALRHYEYLPFKEESVSALHKFYNYMPGDVRDKIDDLKNRIDFVIPAREAEFPYLSILLEAAVEQKVLLIGYESQGEHRLRPVQPVGIYAAGGLWYCPAYCFLRGGLRVFRCDRIDSVTEDASGLTPLDLRRVHLGNRHTFEAEGMAEGQQEGDGLKPEPGQDGNRLRLRVELTVKGVQACEGEMWSSSLLHVDSDGTGRLEGTVPERDLRYFAGFLIGIGHEATVQEPAELVKELRAVLEELLEKYS